MNILWLIASAFILLSNYAASQTFDINVSGALRDKVKKLKRTPQV